MPKHNKSTASHARRGRAYRILKRMAIAQGYMRHTNDVAGFERFCKYLENKVDDEDTDDKPTR